MDYMFPSRNNENLLLSSSNKLTNHENINIRQEQEEEQQPLFLHFPSPFLDNNMDTNTNLDHHRIDNISTDGCRTTRKMTSNNCPLKAKCVRKKRGVGKKDRHSKIHTAQGLRDRRMRLSVHTARKFFDLNDMLGFDKASKTIEWLFAQSQKAIEEVTTETTTLQSDDGASNKEINNECESPLSETVMEITASTDIDDNLELHQSTQHVSQIFDIGDETSRKPIESYPLVNKSTTEARSRAMERTRDTMMIKHLEKPKQLFQLSDPHPSVDDFNQSHELGFSKNNNLDNMEDQSSSCYPLEYSNTYHFLKHLHLDNNNNNAKNDTNYLGNITSISSTSFSVFDYNKPLVEPPAGWLNSRNTFLGLLGGSWDTTNSRMEASNGITPSNGNMNGKNPASGLISSSFSNFDCQGQ